MSLPSGKKEIKEMLVADARRLPVAIQEVAVQEGLIPYLNPSYGFDLR